MSSGVRSPQPEPPAPPSPAGVVLGSILLAFGILLSIVGSLTLTVGLVAAGANELRDEDRYFSTPTAAFSTESYALVSAPTGRVAETRRAPSLPFDLATLRIRVTSDGSEVFLGIAPRADVERYLDDVAITEIRSVRYRPFEADYRARAGSRTPEPPDDQDFWIESAMGAGTQEIEWSIAPGEWGIVVMNADGSAGVDVDLQAAVRSDLIGPAATAVIVLGSALLLVGLPLLIVGAVTLGRSVRRRGGGGPGTPSATPSGGPGIQPAFAGAPTPYPARLSGMRDERLSRWLWLVKWLLAIPHLFILFFLWFAFFVTTVFAGFAVLFTGRYPRSLFTFNVGVIRWNWRVTFYAYGVLGTDRYPPFTLAKTDYPADFDVDYPERLNNWLVLVKWWLLAIPHYLIFAAVSGPVLWGWQWGRDDMVRTGLSLVGVLVLIVGVALLFTARYPSGLFDLLLGVHRWMHRALAYAALLRDEFPPFRLDQGGADPGGRGAAP